MKCVFYSVNCTYILCSSKGGDCILRKFCENFALFIIFGAIYCGIELMFRGYTDFSMAIVGGLCGIIIGGINNYIPWNMPIVQ